QTTVDRALGLPIPASAGVHGTTASTTWAPASSPATPTVVPTTPASTTPAWPTPATATPPGGAQPGTVAPTATTTVPTATAAAPTSTAPAASAPTTTVLSSTVVGVARKPKHGAGLSKWSLALAILGALLALGCIVWG